MSNLTYTKSEIGLEVVILNDGSAYCTQSSYARFSGKDRSTIIKRAAESEMMVIDDFKGCEKTHTLIKTKIETNGGLQEVVLIPAKIFGRWLAKDNPDLFDSVVEAGATQFLYKVAGYEIKASLPEPEPTPQPVGIDPNELNLLRLGLTSVNTALVDGLILNELGKLKPNLLPQIKEAQKLIAATNIIPFVLMTPTVLGKELGVSAIKVNRMLCELGYQVKNENKSKGSPDYLPVGKGLEYAEMTMSTGSNGDNTTYQHLKWKEKIKDVLRRNLK